MIPGVSVIVCCYNSSLRLDETLGHLKNQKTNGIAFEIIIVDNGSTDDTAAQAEKFLNGSMMDYTIVSEPESGLSFARKKGYTISKYDYLLYCDDDNWLADNYVRLAFETMSANASIGILGGQAEAVFEIKEPPWFKQFEIDFAVGDQSAAQAPLSKVNEVYGAGFTIRKSYLNQLFNSGFKSLLSDRKGNQLTSGGDIEFCYLAKYFGYEVWYLRDLKFRHFMTKGRLNWDYLKKLYIGNGIKNIYTRAYQYIETHKQIPGQKLRFPFWLDTFLHKVKDMIAFYPKVANRMSLEGNADVLRFIAMKSEAMEIWALKNKYLVVYESIYSYLNKLTKEFSN